MSEIYQAAQRMLEEWTIYNNSDKLRPADEFFAALTNLLIKINQANLRGITMGGSEK
jgi:hypothetical protein